MNGGEKVIDTMLVYYFVDPDLGVEIFKRQQQNIGVDTEIGNWGTCLTLVLGDKEIFIFFGDKKD